MSFGSVEERRFVATSKPPSCGNDLPANNERKSFFMRDEEKILYIIK